jgi:hypothetical protein
MRWTPSRCDHLGLVTAIAAVNGAGLAKHSAQVMAVNKSVTLVYVTVVFLRFTLLCTADHLIAYTWSILSDTWTSTFVENTENHQVYKRHKRKLLSICVIFMSKMFKYIKRAIFKWSMTPRPKLNKVNIIITVVLRNTYSNSRSRPFHICSMFRINVFSQTSVISLLMFTIQLHITWTSSASMKNYTCLVGK